MVKQFFQYKVSDDGHIWLPSGKEVSYYKTPSAITVAMRIPVHYRNTYSVGEIVYAVFAPNVPNDFWIHRERYMIFHADGNVLNNHITNLKLVKKRGKK